MKKGNLFFGLLFLPLIWSFQCKDNDDVYCTMEFRSIVVSLLDSVGQKQQPDAFYVVDLKSRDTVRTHLSDDYGMGMGDIVIFTDGDMRYTSNSAGGKEFEFAAFRDQKLLVKETYRIAHDRCHIQLLSGALELRVN